MAGKESGVFAGALTEICLHSRAAPGRPLRWAVIANPRAGGFTIRARWKRHRRELAEAAERAAANPPREGRGDFIAAVNAEHAGRAAEDFLAECLRVSAAPAPAPEARPFFLLITAGGDGTSLEALTRIFHAPEAARDNLAVLRLPMGTGNDGADSASLSGALALLTGRTAVVRQRALRLVTAAPGKGPFLAFNILSVGLDAFVTHMTNKMKGRLPGDSYKLWVDIAALFYDKLYTVAPMEIRVWGGGEGEEPRLMKETPLLLAVGASGRRTYGSGKRILPDERNVCLVRQMPLARKLALKGLFTTGAHAAAPETALFSASRVEFRGNSPLLAQRDGETTLLEPDDFPAAIELTAPVIPVLRPASPFPRNGG